MQSHDSNTLDIGTIVDGVANHCGRNPLNIDVDRAGLGLGLGLGLGPGL